MTLSRFCLFILILALVVLGGCDSQDNFAVTQPGQQLQITNVELLVSAQPSVLTQGHLGQQISAEVTNFQVTVFALDLSSFQELIIARDGTARFLLTESRYLIRVLGLDQNRNTLGYFDRILDLSQEQSFQFPGLRRTSTPPAPDPNNTRPFFLFTNSPVTTPSATAFAVSVQAYDGDGRVATSVISDIELSSTGLSLETNPNGLSTSNTGTLTISDLRYPLNSTGVAGLVIGGGGTAQSLSNPVTVTTPEPFFLELTRDSVGSAGEESNSPSDGSALSSDGRFHLFSSAASNLVPNDTNGVTDVFVKDRITGSTTRVSLPLNGQSDGDSFAGDISADGQLVVFWSTASNLVPNDTNGRQD